MEAYRARLAASVDRVGRSRTAHRGSVP